MSTKRKAVRKLHDGTHVTQLAVYTQPWARRIAVASCFTGDHAEIELRSGTVVVGRVVTAAQMVLGTTSDVIVVQELDRLVPTAYSLANVRSIAGLTDAELDRRRHA